MDSREQRHHVEIIRVSRGELRHRRGIGFVAADADLPGVLGTARRQRLDEGLFLLVLPCPPSRGALQVGPEAAGLLPDPSRH